MSAQQIQANMKELREIEIEIKRKKEELKFLTEKEKCLKIKFKINILYLNFNIGKTNIPLASCLKLLVQLTCWIISMNINYTVKV